MGAAVDRVMTCSPDYFVMGMSSETFWDGLAKSEEVKAHIQSLTGLRVAKPSDDPTNTLWPTTTGDDSTRPMAVCSQTFFPDFRSSA